jgi:GNAT superfamily N-acetyltransferase
VQHVEQARVVHGRTLPSPAMPIRPATASDIDEIAALIRELAAYEKLEHEVVLDPAELHRELFGADPAASVLIAEDDGAVAGFALYFRTFSTFLGAPGLWLEDLFVRPQFRGRGLGRALLEEVRRQTTGRVEWAVLDWNAPSIAFYKRIGAQPVEGWTRYRWQLA